MPCYDPRDHATWRDIEECRDRCDEEYNDLKAKYDKLTDLLCTVCRTMESDGMFTYIDENPELRAWWDEHKRLDAEKAERERSNRESAKQAIVAAARHIVSYNELAEKEELAKEDKEYFRRRVSELEAEIRELASRFQGIEKEAFDA